MLTSTSLFIFQFLAHLSLLHFVFNGSLLQWLVLLVVYFFTGCLGMTMTYHRLLSHRCWSPPKGVERLFVLFATVGLTGSALSWVAIHRAHHKNTDKLGDPHSPTRLGYLRCQYLSMFSKVSIRNCADLMVKPFYQTQHKHYFTINLAYALSLWLIDPYAVVYAWLAPAAMLWTLGSLIITVSHRGGKVHNDVALAVLVWGEGYHSTHHDTPRATRLGKYDLGGLLIELLDRSPRAS